MGATPQPMIRVAVTGSSRGVMFPPPPNREQRSTTLTILPARRHHDRPLGRAADDQGQDSINLNPKGPVMLDLHFWPTPNGKKVTILLEELGIKYNLVPCNIGRG